MSRSVKILIGVLTLVPLICLIIYLWSFFSIFSDIMQSPQNPEKEMESFFNSFGSLMFTILVMLLFSFGLLIYYIIHAVNNQTIDANERLVWILVFIFTGMIGFIIYWILRIWGEGPVKPAAPPAVAP